MAVNRYNKSRQASGTTGIVIGWVNIIRHSLWKLVFLMEIGYSQRKLDDLTRGQLNSSGGVNGGCKNVRIRSPERGFSTLYPEYIRS